MASSAGSSEVPLSLIPAGRDPFWAFGEKLVANDTNRIKCNYCKQTVNGGITRFKHHLAGWKGNVKPCPQVPADVKAKADSALNSNLASKRAKSAKLQASLDEVVIGVHDEVEDSVTHWTGSKGPMDQFVHASAESSKGKDLQQSTIESKYKKKARDDATVFIVHWWRLNGADTPHLKTMAMKILSLTTSSSGCERNWSTFEMIHSKKRNKLDSKRLNDLVFVKFNALLKTKYSNTSRDPLEAMSLESGKIQEWMVNIDADEDENEDGDDEVFPGEGLTWAQLGDIVDADQDTRRPPRLTTNKEVSISYQRKRKRKISEMDETQLEGSSSSDDDHILSTMPTIAESTSDED